MVVQRTHNPLVAGSSPAGPTIRCGARCGCVMTPEIALVLVVLGATVILFVTEALRVDVIAIAIMVALPWLGLVKPAEAFSGLASNAVVAVLAVMILGYGVDRCGVMARVTRPILRVAGRSERKLIGLVSATVGGVSAFMQNIGAAALFLPALLRISKSTGIPSSRLLMPMGFASILGGTLTLVGSGPLIILNDLLRQGGLQPYGLFSVTPIGLALVVAGIVYFLVLGKTVLPSREPEAKALSAEQELIETWQLPRTVRRCAIPPGSGLVGKTREDARIWTEYGLNLLALTQEGDVVYAPWRFTQFAAGQELSLLGSDDGFSRFVGDHSLRALSDPAEPGIEGAAFAELIIPPKAPIAGKTMREIALRKTFGVEPIMLLSGRQERRTDFSDEVLDVGAAIIVYGPAENIHTMADNRSFSLITPVPATAGAVRRKPLLAVLCTLAAVAMALSGVQLSVALFTGALAMILLKVISIDEAYQAVDWRTVFLLAGLIPLGIAMEKTGGASFVAAQLMRILHGSHPLFILGGVAVLTTLFSLFMSNVAATVLLVPLVILIGQSSGIPPRALAMLVAVCASNSFMLPTHQVNALLMGPGGYRNRDYVRAGGIMSVIFIVIAVSLTYAFYM
jgi:di/tricarboxylate transporter